MIHHRELAFALAQGGAAPYLARVLRVITQALAIEGALLVRLEGQHLDIVSSYGLPVHLLKSMDLSEPGHKLLRAGGRFANVGYHPILADKPFVATAPYWRSIVIVPVESPQPGLELRFVGGSSDPQPPAVKTLISELFHDLIHILAEELRLIFDLAIAVTDAPSVYPALDRVAEAQLPFESSQSGSDVVVRFLLDTLLMKNRVRTRNGMSYYALRTWRKTIKTEQIAAIKAIKAHAHPALEEHICRDAAEWIASTFGAKRFDAVVPVPCGHSGPDCLSVRAARKLGANLGVPTVEAFEPLPQPGVSHPKTNQGRARMRLREQVEGDILLIDDIATSGAHLEEATKLLRGNGNSVVALAWIADG